MVHNAALLVVVLGWLASAAGCDDGTSDAPDAGEEGCTVTAPTQCPDPAPTYADVEPIFREHCVLPCHGVASGPWSLATYGHVADWELEVRGMVLRCAMPPPDSGVELSTAEREAILTWIRCDLPE